jgi:4-oxalmesaconate hydratase
MDDRSWYPLYEAMAELDVPAMIHVSATCNDHFHTTGSHYLGADTTAFMQLMMSDVLRDFPSLRFIIPHGGGAVPYHWGRFRGLART